MNRRNFFVNFFLGIASFILGYKVGVVNDSNLNQNESTVNSEINDKLTIANENLSNRGINIKYPPAPLVGAKVDGKTDDTKAIRAIFEYANQKNTKIIIPGISVITGEIEIKSPILIEGIGAGSGYGGNNDLKNYHQISGFLVKGNGKKRLRTRRKYRENAASPKDELLSVALNIQAENVVLKDFTVFLDFDKENNSPTNYGAKWDVGIFIGCRTHFYADNVHVLGYFRQAGFYFDVTHATNLPRFNDLDGKPYPDNMNTSGGDGCTMLKCYVKGAKWGVFVAGGIRKNGKSVEDPAPLFYDELSNQKVEDLRGTFGFSDFTMIACSIYGTDHHSSYRRDSATGNYLTDPSGGSMFIDGMAGNSSGCVQGMRFISTRFATFEPFKVKLDQANRVQFIGCHFEHRGGIERRTSNGKQLKFDDTDTYEYITCTKKTDNIVIFGGTNHASRPGSKYIPANVHIHNFAPAGTVTGTSTTDTLVAAGFEAIKDELNLRSARPSSPIIFQQGDNNTAAIDKEGFTFLSNIENPTISSTSGHLNLNAPTDSNIYFRIGNSSGTFIDKTALKPSKDNEMNLGTPSLRFKQIYSVTGLINTSDRNAKKDIKPISDKVLDAWSEVGYSQYRFIDKVEPKNMQARIHFGIIAQEIKVAFERHGLNAFDYGILYYDEWNDIYEEITEEKTPLTLPIKKKEKVRSSGKLYSIRPDECLMLEAALMRRTNKQLEARIAVLATD